MEQIDRFEILMRMSAEYMPKEYNKDIFHYTSPEGFQSILFSDSDKVTLWASRYDCLNDSSEGTIAEDVLMEVCVELKSNKEITLDQFELFSKVKTARTILLNIQDGDKIRLTRPDCNRFVCSFSKNRDSLAMWNYYSKGNKYEGFNIGFYPNCLKTTIESYFEAVEAVPHIYPVIYSKDEQKSLIRALLLKLKEFYHKDKESQIRCIIANRLLDWGLVFKNECFQHEEEVRVIIDVAKREHNVPIQYRFNSGFIIPYIELKVEKDDVSYVTFGPLHAKDLKNDQQVNIMNEILGKNDFCALVDYSKIPIRY